MSKLQDKVAIVTGASKGIGASIAKHLAAEGAAVVVNYASSKDGADRVVSEILKNGGRAVAVQANVAKHADIRRLFTEANEGIRQARYPGQQRGDLRVFPDRGHHGRALPQAVRSQRAGTDPRQPGSGEALRPGGWRSIVNISSVVSTLSPPNTSVYSATKAAVDAVTRSLAKELGPRKIRVNSINPGMVETEGVHAAGIADSDFRKQIEVSNTARPDRTTPRHRTGGCLPRFGGFRLDHRRNTVHLGRPALIVASRFRRAHAIPALARSRLP